MTYPLSADDCIREFKEFAISVGKPLPANLKINTSDPVHCQHPDKKKGNKSLAYKLMTDGTPTGLIWDYINGDAQKPCHKWVANKPRTDYTPEQRKQFAIDTEAKRQKHEENEAQKHATAAKLANEIATQGKAATGHDHLVRKKTGSHNALLNTKRWKNPFFGQDDKYEYLARPVPGDLIIRYYDENETIVTLEIISPNGNKKFLKGGNKQGCFHYFGVPTSKIIICESWSTGASLFEASQLLTISSGGKGNLKAVAEIFRRKFPNAEIVVCGDNDKDGGGQKAAIDAALAVDGKYLIPDTEGKDWNDILSGGGTISLTNAVDPNTAIIDQTQKEEPVVSNIVDFGKAVNHESVVAQLPDGTNLSPLDIAVLNDMNDTYTHAVIGGKNLIISLKHCQVQGKTFSFEPLDEFKKGFMHLSRIGKKNKGQAWLEWGDKNFKQYGTGFYPLPEKCPEGVFNFFQGYRVKPVAGDCTIYLDHLQNIICNGDVTAYAYLIEWIAHLFQKPDEKPHVSIVLKSIEGAGKGLAVAPLLKILGTHGNQTNGSYALSGRFNGLIANKLLIFADEVDLTDKHVANKLKGIITEPSVNLERKGLEIEPLPNYCRLIFASNHTRVLAAGIRERRYLVLEPSDAKAQNSEYFEALDKFERNGGAAKLLNYFLGVDISRFNRHKCPQTSGLIDEKLANLKGIHRYFYKEITSPEPFGGMARLFAHELVRDFMTWCADKDDEINEASARSIIGKMMVRLNIPVLGRSDRSEGKFYELPTDMTEIKRAFAELLDIPVEYLTP